MNESTRICPSCSRAMLELEVRGIEVDRCGLCEGVYFDFGELQELASHPLGLAWADGPGPACPDCGSPMRQARLVDRRGHPVESMGCECCEGLWLPGATVRSMLGEVNPTPPEPPAALEACSVCRAPFGAAPPVPSRSGLLCEACAGDLVEHVPGPLFSHGTNHRLERLALGSVLALFDLLS